jgi:hypothetical protein
VSNGRPPNVHRYVGQRDVTARHDAQRGLPRFYTLAETARTLRKSERWLWDWLKHHPRDSNGQPFFRLASHRKCSATLNEPLNVATSQKGHRTVSKQNLHS